MSSELPLTTPSFNESPRRLSPLPTDLSQPRRHSTPLPSRRSGGAADNEEADGREISILVTDFSPHRRQSTPNHRAGTIANGWPGEETSPQHSAPSDENNSQSANGPETSSQTLKQPPNQSQTNDKHIWNALPIGPTVISKMRKWIHSRRLWCLVAILIAISLGVPIGYTLRIRDFEVPPASGNSTIKLLALLADVDPRLRTMTIDWLVDDATCHSQPCEIYDIFFDSSLLVSGSGYDSIPSTNNSIPKTPVFSVDSKFMNPNASRFANAAFFTTEVSLLPGISSGNISTRTLQSYPFDRYLAVVSIFAKNRNDTSDEPHDPVSISITGSGGIAAGFATKVNPSEDNFKNGDFINLVIDISRGIEVRVYAVIIITAIWLVTLVLLSATTSAIFLGRRIAKEVLLIPVATLFAFTSLRGTMPSAPTGFGAIMDYIGILPCLAILTFCAVLHIGVFLVRNPEKDRNGVGGKGE